MKKSKLKPGSRVWIVARHSPGRNQSITSQLSALDRYCQANQLQVVDSFIDAGESGNNRNREEFTRMRRKAESSEVNLVDGIVFYDPSRFARDFDDAQYTKSMLRYKGYSLEWIIGEQYEGVAGHVVEVIEDHQNAKYLEVLSEKSRDGLRTMIQLKAPDGSYLGFWPGRVPWGFRKVLKELPVINTATGKARIRQCIEPDYDLWDLGRELYHLRASGLSYQEIEAKTGFFSSRNSFDVGNKDSLVSNYRAFYKNTIYKGLFTYKEITIPDYVPAMVDAALWDEVNATSLKSDNYRPGKRGKAAPAFLLAGLCLCGHCGDLLYTKQVAGEKYRYYLCKTMRRFGTEACNSRHTPAIPLEQAVIDHAKSHYFGGKFVQTVTDAVNRLLGSFSDLQPLIEEREAELEGISQKLYNLARLAEGASDVGEILKRINELKEARRLAESRLLLLTSRRLPQKIDFSPERVAEALSHLYQRLTMVNEARPVLWQIISKVRVERERAMIFYKLPLVIGDSIPRNVLDIHQIGYVIQLPVNGYKQEVDNA